MLYFQALKKIRRNKKITSIELAKYLNKTRETVSAWERGLRQPCDADIRLIAQILSVPVSDISDLQEIRIKNGTQNNIPDLNINALSPEVATKVNNLYETSLELMAINTRLRSNLFKYDVLLQSLPFIIYVKDKKLKYIFVNERFLNLIEQSYSKNSISGVSSFDIFGIKEYAQVLELEQKVLQTKQKVSSYQIHIPGTFKQKIGLLTIIPILNDQKEVEELVGSIEDITDTYTEEKMRKDLESIVNKINHMLWIGEEAIRGYEESFKYTFISDNVSDIFGVEKKDILQNSKIWLDLITNDNIEEVKDFIKIKSFPKRNEYKINHPKKGVRWISTEVFREGDNKFFGITTDITEEKEQKQEKEVILKTLDAATDAIKIAKIKGDSKEYIFINKGNKNLYEQPIAKIKGNPDIWKELVHPADKEKLLLVSEEKQKGHSRLNYRLLFPDQKIKYVEERIFRDFIDGTLYSGTIERDITKEKKQFKEKVEHITTRLNSVLNCFGTSHWWKDANGVYGGSNKADAELLNMSVDEIIGKTDYDLPWSDHADVLVKNDIKVMETGKTIRFIENVKTKQGDIKRLVVTKSPLRNHKGKIIGTIGSSVDITGIQKIENMLLELDENIN